MLVPVCVSASHIAFTSLRMEPVWMILGESAGVAASIAADNEIAVQDVPYKILRPKLEELGQTLDRLEQDRTQHKSVRWKSKEHWNNEKNGYEWLFPHIDKDSNGEISVDEYTAFQRFKSKNDDWEQSLKKTEFKR